MNSSIQTEKHKKDTINYGQSQVLNIKRNIIIDIEEFWMIRALHEFNILACLVTKAQQQINRICRYILKYLEYSICSYL